VITGDLDRALAAPVSSMGTWRPVPPAGSPASPRGYASTVAFLLAEAGRGEPAALAAALAARLTALDWVETAAVTGGGYLTVAVTPAALAALAVRITEAGPACARSDALSGTSLAAPATAALAAARTWEQAHDRLTRHVTGRLAAAAGAHVTWIPDTERTAGAQPGPASPAGPVAEAVAFAGEGMVTFALCRLAPGARAWLDQRVIAAHDLGNPAYAVRYAHAHAASVLRQAADLGLARGTAAAFRPWLLAHPSEQALLGTLSWLPERVAGAARRGQPDVLARYLEELAGSYFGCHERCPAVPPGAGAPGSGPSGGGSPSGGPSGGGPPRGDLPAGWPPQVAGQAGADPGSVASARLWLAAAARTALAAGLDLLGVDAPERL
jgi:arginyl-tRNA synthetase